jgi:hypothetical protein
MMLVIRQFTVKKIKILKIAAEWGKRLDAVDSYLIGSNVIHNLKKVGKQYKSL